MATVITYTAGGGAMAFVSASSLQEEFITDAVEALATENIYVDGDAELSTAQELSSLYDDSSVAVVALPSEAGVGTYDEEDIADQIKSEDSDLSTVIVVVGDDFGVAADSNTDAIYEVLNASGATPGEAILAAKDVIAETSNSSQPAAEDQGLPAFVEIGGISAVVVIAAVATVFFRKFKPKKPAVDNAYMAALPVALKTQLEELERLTALYRNSNEHALSEPLTTVQKHARELFVRMKKKADTTAYNSAGVQYKDTLQKLNAALSEDYYYDIMKNPALWTDAERRKTEVITAVKATDQQLVRNIQQVNANEDIEIKVALESLTRSMEKPAFERIYDK